MTQILDVFRSAGYVYDNGYGTFSQMKAKKKEAVRPSK